MGEIEYLGNCRGDRDRGGEADAVAQVDVANSSLGSNPSGGRGEAAHQSWRRRFRGLGGAKRRPGLGDGSGQLFEILGCLLHVLERVGVERGGVELPGEVEASESLE